MLVRERERSLAMELSTIDHELAESRSRLARLQGKEAALLQQVSAPLALETQWAKEAAESCRDLRTCGDDSRLTSSGSANSQCNGSS